MTTKFKIRCRKIRKQTCEKAPLWEIEYAPGCSTNVYAHTRADALAKVIGNRCCT
jgi:hypothetical protein